MGLNGFTATAWHNGSPSKSGAGYGLKIGENDRNRFLKREWKTVSLRFPDTDEGVEVNIDKDSFWNETCRELISADIGKWLIRNKLAPWENGSPPKFFLEPSGERSFKVNRAKV